MYITETSIRVRYGETDQMGYVYYGNYAMYYEVGRVEAFRQLGLTYKSLEESGFMLPVYTFNITYFKPAYYDDLLVIKTTIKRVEGAKIYYEYEMYNVLNELLNKGETTLVFINKTTKRPCLPPDFFLETLKPFFS